MKLTYEQMRELAKVGDPTGKVPIKNHKGRVLRPTTKQWAHPQKNKYMSTEGPQRLFHAPMVNHSQTFPQASCSPRPPPRAKR